MPKGFREREKEIDSLETPGFNGKRKRDRYTDSISPITPAPYRLAGTSLNTVLLLPKVQVSSFIPGMMGACSRGVFRFNCHYSGDTQGACSNLAAIHQHTSSSKQHLELSGMSS